MSKPICTVMVGLPGTGKSTLVEKERAIYTGIDVPVFVYSTDNLIEEWAAGQGWTYDFAFSKYVDKATSEMNRLLDIAIQEKTDIIWDQTNLGAKKRAKIINRMRQAGYQVRCVCIVPPEASFKEVCGACVACDMAPKLSIGLVGTHHHRQCIPTHD